MQNNKMNWVVRLQVLFLAVAYVVTQLALYELFTTMFTLMVIVVFNALVAVYILEYIDQTLKDKEAS